MPGAAGKKHVSLYARWSAAQVQVAQASGQNEGAMRALWPTCRRVATGAAVAQRSASRATP
eukprot:405958-Prymnesium_polylepis.1